MHNFIDAARKFGFPFHFCSKWVQNKMERNIENDWRWTENCRDGIDQNVHMSTVNAFINGIQPIKGEIQINYCVLTHMHIRALNLITFPIYNTFDLNV